MDRGTERRVLKARRHNRHGVPKAAVVSQDPVSRPRYEERCFANNRLKRLRQSLGSEQSPIKKRMKPESLSVQSRLSIAAKSNNTSATSHSSRHMFTSTPNKRQSNLDLSLSQPKILKCDSAIASTSEDSLYHSQASNVSLICNANSTQDLNDEDMQMEMDIDYSYVPEENLLTDIQYLRAKMKTEAVPQTNFSYFNLKYENIPSSNNIFIVVDTNVFIDKLQVVINILNITYCDDTRPVIYVPWMVIQELDYFKDGYHISKKKPMTKYLQKQCRRAIKFINESLLSKKGNMIGESAMESAQNKYHGSSPDDRILGSCLRIAEQNKTMLITSDVNLRNKSLINKIDAFCPSKVVEHLKGYKMTKVQKNIITSVSKSLAFTLSFIFMDDAKSLGITLEDFPWDLRKCVNYMKNSYDVHFRSSVQKQCRKVVDDLFEMFSNDDINENSLIELSLSLLIYLKTGKPRYGSSIQACIEEVSGFRGNL